MQRGGRTWGAACACGVLEEVDGDGMGAAEKGKGDAAAAAAAAAGETQHAWFI